MKLSLCYARVALCALLALPVLAAVNSAPLYAQSSASLTGTVLDPRGVALPGTTVSAKNDATGDVKKTNSDAQGKYAYTDLPAGNYTIQVDGPGFSSSRRSVELVAGKSTDVAVTLELGNVSEQITVEASVANSTAAAYAPMDALLDATSARTEVSALFIQNFTAPAADFSELIQQAPGAFSVNPNGVGLGDSKTYFRGFSDGSYDITFDGIPFNDTNDPTHHSWAFFPSPWIGGVDFDRSPGDATTIGPAPYGGSINLLSRELSPDQILTASVSYGSFNTLLRDFTYDSGGVGGVTKRNNVFIDVHELTSDGYETFNAQQRIGGSLKYQLRLSDKATLTGFSGVLLLDTNTPDSKLPTRGNVALYGRNYLLSSDSTNSLYYGYNSYHVPTDFEYVAYRAALPHGWNIYSTPYTMSYNNAQYFAVAPKAGGGVMNAADCAPIKNKLTPAAYYSPCAVNKTNTYRKYGENTEATQVSRFGILSTGLWYEWAATDRFQTPSTPFQRIDDVLPNFHEKFWTNSYNPYGQYRFHATKRLDITGGLKYARFNQDLKQSADVKTVGYLGGTPVTTNGVTTGLTGGAPFKSNYGGYGTWLPAASAHYVLKPNWTTYFQFATGSVIPPSSVFDVNGTVTLLPKPTTAKTYQAGSVLKFKKVTVDADAFYTHFQNTYVSNPDPNSTAVGATAYSQGGDSVSKGFEAEANVYIGHGLSFYGNGTAGSARYVSQTIGGQVNTNYKAWVANTPSDTESLGFTYQQKYFDVGMFNKRVGSLWNDVKGSAGTVNQAIAIDPFNITNFYINYTVRNGSHFDQSKLKLSFNNLFNTDAIVGVGQAASANVYTPGPNDTLTQTPPRSVTLTVTFGYSPKR